MLKKFFFVSFAFMLYWQSNFIYQKIFILKDVVILENKLYVYVDYAKQVPFRFYRNKLR